MTLKTATFMKEDARVTDAEEARLQKAMSRGGRVGGVGAGRDSSPALNKPATGFISFDSYSYFLLTKFRWRSVSGVNYACYSDYRTTWKSFSTC